MKTLTIPELKEIINEQYPKHIPEEGSYLSYWKYLDPNEFSKLANSTSNKVGNSFVDYFTNIFNTYVYSDKDISSNYDSDIPDPSFYDKEPKPGEDYANENINNFLQNIDDISDEDRALLYNYIVDNPNYANMKEEDISREQVYNYFEDILKRLNEIKDENFD